MSYISPILASGSVSASANLTIDLSTLYNLYSTIQVEVYNLQFATDNVSINMLVSVDGTTFDNGAGNYQYQLVSANAGGGAASSTGSNSATSILLASSMIGSGALSSAMSSFVVKAHNLSSSSFLPLFRFELNYVTTSTNLTASNFGSGARTTAQITKALRFVASSGNITASYRVTGYK